LAPSIVVILDNLATPKKLPQSTPCVTLDAGSSPCQPIALSDLAPIKMAFSKLKLYLRRIGAWSFANMFDTIAKLCDGCSSRELWTDFTAAGYLLD
jgi:transposase